MYISSTMFIKIIRLYAIGNVRLSKPKRIKMIGTTKTTVFQPLIRINYQFVFRKVILIAVQIAPFTSAVFILSGFILNPVFS